MAGFPDRIIVTGAGSGLGRTLSADLAARGCRLVLADHNPTGLEETVQSIRSREIVTRTADVTRPDANAALVEAALQHFGGLDALILCAGVSMWARFEEIRDLSVFEKLVSVNYLGAVYAIHAALPHLRQTRGRIVAISSLQGEVALPYHSGYTAAKHALNGFLDTLDFELGGEVRILTVMPGWISGTNLRANAFTAEPKGPRRHNRHAVSVEECSRRILRAIERGDRRLYIPRKLGALKWLRLFAPGLVRSIIAKAVRSQRH